MVRVNYFTRLAFLLSVLLGIFGGIFDQYQFVLFSAAIIFLSLSFSSEVKGHQIIFLFPLVFLSGLSFNVRLSMAFTSLSYGADITLHSFLLFMIVFFTLLSVEELILCVLGLLLWGKQALIHYKHPVNMLKSSRQNDYSVRGYFPDNSDTTELHYLHKL